jgi:hypothetical protein
LLSVEKLEHLQITGQIGATNPTPRLPDRDERVIDNLPPQPTQPESDEERYNPSYDSPHPEADLNPEVTAATRKRRMLEEVRDTVVDVPDALARLNARVAEFRGDKQMTWLAGELAQIATRLRTITDSIEAFYD